jgi:DnaJ-class molecular chaperone
MFTSAANYAKEDCRWCSGSAIDYSTGDPCGVCRGQGVILVTMPPRSCTSCGGSGRISDEEESPCPVCQGCGWAERISSTSV